MQHPGVIGRGIDGVTVFGEAFARYSHESWGTSTYRAFDLPRARLGADVEMDRWFGGRVMVETVRSAAPGSLYGVDGDSIVVRAREIYGEARSGDLLPTPLTARFGLVPTLIVSPLEKMWGRRVLSPVLLETAGWESPADLGATLALAFPHRLGEVTVGAFNGEGLTQHEQNDGKNVAASLRLTPLATTLPPGPGEQGLQLFFAAENGSLGPAQARANRYVGAVAYEHRYAALGADYSLADGIGGSSAQRGRALSVWGRLGPFAGFEGVFRLDSLDPDRKNNGAKDQITTLLGGVGYHAALSRPQQAFDIYLTYHQTSGGELAMSADPQLPRRGPRVDLRVAF
jgi:hypothetical protein